MSKDDPLWPELKSFYDFKDDLDPTLFLARTNEGKRRVLYFTNHLVKDLVSLNQDRMKVFNSFSIMHFIIINIQY